MSGDEAIERKEWATTEHLRGLNELRGLDDDDGRKFEVAIEAFGNARSVYQYHIDPLNWARITLDLASAYLSRTVGSRKQNLREAIALFTEALQVYDRDANPQEWAECHEGLGSAYFRQIEVFETENARKAVFHFQLAAVTMCKDAFPEAWHTIHFYLGVLYDVYLNDGSEERQTIARKQYALAYGFDRNEYPVLASTLRTLEDLHRSRKSLHDQVRELDRTDTTGLS
jgi:tetratricopeptide (TPR) repeat protein